MSSRARASLVVATSRIAHSSGRLTGTHDGGRVVIEHQTPWTLRKEMGEERKPS